MSRRYNSTGRRDGGNENLSFNKESIIDISAPRPRLRRKTQSSNEGLREEIHLTPRRRAHSTFGFETRSPDDYSPQERPTINYSNLNIPAPSPRLEQPNPSFKNEREYQYRPSQTKRSKSTETTNLRLQEERLQDERLRHEERVRYEERLREERRRKAPMDYASSSESETYYTIRRKEHEKKSPDEFERRHHYESVSERETRAEVKEEIRRESRESVRRASSNLKQYGAGDSRHGGDPRKYMELKYGVLIDATEKTLEEVEDETAFVAEIEKKESEVFDRYSSRLHEPRVHAHGRQFTRRRPNIKPETLLFSEPLELSDSNSDSEGGASDDQVQQILNAVISSQNLTLPDDPYEPQTEAFKEERYPHYMRATATSAPIHEERVSSVQDRERSIYERERSLRSREASMREREAALEDRERQAYEASGRRPSGRTYRPQQQASEIRDDSSGYERPTRPGQPRYSSDEDSQMI